jgi:hypothetical protein
LENDKQDFWSKIFIIERDLLENQRSINKLDISYQEVLSKLENIKDELRNKRSVDDFEDRIKDLEEMVDSLRQEMPEIRLIRKIVFTLVAFILTAFLGLMWNTVTNQPKKSDSIDEISKKIINEYKKNESK